MTNLCSPIITVTCFTTLAELSQVVQRNLGFCRNSFKAGLEKRNCIVDCMRYGLDFRVFTITTTNRDTLRYCVPMDNQRPQLDLKFFKDICPDKNGASLRTFMTVFNTIISSPCHSHLHQIQPVPAKCPNQLGGFRKPR